MPRCSTARYQVPGASSAICVGEPSSAKRGRATGTANQNGLKSAAGAGVAAAWWPAPESCGPGAGVGVPPYGGTGCGVEP